MLPHCSVATLAVPGALQLARLFVSQIWIKTLILGGTTFPKKEKVLFLPRLARQYCLLAVLHVSLLTYRSWREGWWAGKRTTKNVCLWIQISTPVRSPDDKNSGDPSWEARRTPFLPYLAGRRVQYCQLVHATSKPRREQCEEE